MSSLCSDGETLEGLQAHMEAVLTQALEGDEYISQPSPCSLTVHQCVAIILSPY